MIERLRAMTAVMRQEPLGLRKDYLQRLRNGQWVSYEMPLIADEIEQLRSALTKLADPEIANADLVIALEEARALLARR